MCIQTNADIGDDKQIDEIFETKCDLIIRIPTNLGPKLHIDQRRSQLIMATIPLVIAKSIGLANLAVPKVDQNPAISRVEELLTGSGNP